MVVSVPIAVVLYVERYLHNAAKILREVLPTSQEVKEGFCLPPQIVVDPADHPRTNQRTFDGLNNMMVDEKTTLATAITVMFDRWMEKVMVDLMHYVRDTNAG
uniref:Uncharacterized protein n=1 Tax=Eutreptiella gymnastica TaxID=73025 RepID=A0A7S1J795_9EUGL|mmetsp:Transcript_72839/g.128337  ORF Transcript_72839/g.128337 Transcript_72839/m.128337 type:complete len:103 (+) Transcript_72839:63-371(+)